MDIPLTFWQQYHLDTITEIDASKSKITDADLEFVAQSCPNLSSLSLAFSYEKLDTGIQSVARHCHNLTSVNLANWETFRVTDAVVMALAKCPNLSSLNLHGCQLVTNVSVVALAKCPNLSSLNLLGCELVTNTSVVALAKCPQLSSLNLSYIEGITDVGVMALGNWLPTALLFKSKSLQHLCECDGNRQGNCLFLQI